MAISCIEFNHPKYDKTHSLYYSDPSRLRNTAVPTDYSISPKEYCHAEQPEVSIYFRSHSSGILVFDKNYALDNLV